MQKVFTLIAVALLGTTFSTVYAQSFFGSSKKPQAAAPTAAPPSKQVLNNQEFKSKVKSLSKQTNDSITNDIQQKMRPTPPPIQPPAGTTSGSGQDPSSQSSNQPPVKIQLDDTSRAQKVRKKQPASAGTRATTPAPGSKAQPSSQPYTGFGGGQKNQGTSGGSSGSSGSGGWNINY